MSICTSPSNISTFLSVINLSNKSLSLNACQSPIVFSNLSYVFNSSKLFYIPLNTTIDARDMSEDVLVSTFITIPNSTWIITLDQSTISVSNDNKTSIESPNSDHANSKDIAYILGGTLGGSTIVSVIALGYMIYKYVFQSSANQPIQISNTLQDNNEIIDNIITDITQNKTKNVVPTYVKMNDEYFIKEDYIPKKKDEIVVLKGDIITLLKIFDDGWAKVSLNNLSGVIPLECIDFTILIEPARD